jgi:hypothetical protein
MKLAAAFTTAIACASVLLLTAAMAMPGGSAPVDAACQEGRAPTQVGDFVLLPNGDLALIQTDLSETSACVLALNSSRSGFEVMTLSLESASVVVKLTDIEEITNTTYLSQLEAFEVPLNAPMPQIASTLCTVRMCGDSTAVVPAYFLGQSAELHDVPGGADGPAGHAAVLYKRLLSWIPAAAPLSRRPPVGDGPDAEEHAGRFYGAEGFSGQAPWEAWRFAADVLGSGLMVVSHLCLRYGNVEAFPYVHFARHDQQPGVEYSPASTPAIWSSGSTHGVIDRLVAYGLRDLSDLCGILGVGDR